MKLASSKQPLREKQDSRRHLRPYTHGVSTNELQADRLDQGSQPLKSAEFGTKPHDCSPSHQRSDMGRAHVGRYPGAVNSRPWSRWGSRHPDRRSSSTLRSERARTKQFVADWLSGSLSVDLGPKGHRLLAVLDGAKALKRCLKVWDDAVIQLPGSQRAQYPGKTLQQHHGKLAEHFAALRNRAGARASTFENAFRKLAGRLAG